MPSISLKDASRQDKVQLLGEAFAAIEVLDADFSGAQPVVRVLLEGKLVTLVGDPQDALTTYLGGGFKGESLAN